MTEWEWAQQTLAQLAQTEPNFDQRALYQAVSRQLKEVQQRLNEAEGEIDGRSWDHQHW